MIMGPRCITPKKYFLDRNEIDKFRFGRPSGGRDHELPKMPVGASYMHRTDATTTAEARPQGLIAASPPGK